MRPEVVKAMDICKDILDNCEAAEVQAAVGEALTKLAEAFAFLSRGNEIEDVMLMEVSMNVSGTPDLHIRNPKQFEKMRSYYDPARVPFTTASWFMTGWFGRDMRPLKTTKFPTP